MNADIVGAGVPAADAGDEFPALPGSQGDLLPIFDPVEVASVAVDVKTHCVDGENAGVLYFGAVLVVLAADRSVDLDLLIDSEKNIVGEDVQRGEGQQQEYGIEPCEGGRASVITGKDKASCQHCKI